MMETKSFVLHDDTVNTYGFRMLTSGAKLEEFRRNPVLLLMHSDHLLPIGRWENIRVEGSRILADPVFDMEDEEAKKIAGKVERGFLRAASIGAWPPEEVSDDPALRLPGQTGFTVTKWTVREASIVTIGANHNALRLYSRDTGEPVDLTDKNAVLKMMDLHTCKNVNMINLREIFGLADTATDADVEAAAQALQKENADLKEENATLREENENLKTEKAAAEQKRIDEQKAEAVSLVDAAVKDGRLNASGKESFIALFDADFEKAKATLNAIPRVKSIKEQMEAGKLSLSDDFASKSWSELDKAGLLVKLKDESPELYREKFRAEFGRDPKF